MREVVRVYSDPLIEHQAVRQEVGLLDLSPWGVVELRGADRRAFPHTLLTNNINILVNGEGCRAALANAGGRLIAELLVLADVNVMWLVLERARIPALLEVFEHHRIMEDVRWADQSDSWRVLALQGPRAPQALAAVGALTLPEKPLAHTVGTVDARPVRVIAHSVTGAPGALLLVEAARAEGVWERFVREDVRTVGWDAFNILRIEAGIPWFGVDMHDTNLLPETGLERTAVSDSKGCYLGQEIIARMTTYGSANQRIVGVRFDGTQPPTPGTELVPDDAAADADPIGRITSACWSPTRRLSIGLATVKRPWYQVETGLRIAEPDGAHGAVADLPFV